MTKREEFEAALDAFDAVLREEAAGSALLCDLRAARARVLALYDEAVEDVAVRLARVTKIANERTDAIVDLMHKNDKLTQPWADEAELSLAISNAWIDARWTPNPDCADIAARVALSRPVTP